MVEVLAFENITPHVFLIQFTEAQVEDPAEKQ